MRLKLHPDDVYTDRGGITERWIASTLLAESSPTAPSDEGLSYIISKDEKVSLSDAIEIAGDKLIGKKKMNNYGGWSVLAKFIDLGEPCPHHHHGIDEQGIKHGKIAKPEAYYFPTQFNLYRGSFPYTFFGFEPGTSKEEILDLSRAYKLKPGTGWILPDGILHAPGTLFIYEVQLASEVYSMFQSMIEGKPINKHLLTKDVVQPEKKENLEYLVNLLDWEKNVEPNFKKRFYLEPISIKDTKNMGYEENWIIYGKINGKEYFSAKELNILPGKKVSIKDNGAYSLIATQGRGKIACNYIESITLVRYGELTSDEFFIIDEAAKKGIEILGNEPLVLLKYFGPDTNPNMPDNNI